MSIEKTQRRFGSALVWYVATVIVFLTLLPFRFSAPTAVRLIGPVSWTDFIANVIFFVPFGFFWRFKGKASPGLVGLLLSGAVEVTQVWIPSRWPSLADVLANTLGAWLGGRLFSMVAIGSARRHWYFRVSAIELPLVGILYLSIPVVWLGGFVTAGDPHRALLAMLIGLAGAAVIGAIDGERPFRPGHRWAAPVIGAGWLAIMLLPWWLADYRIGVAGCLTVFGAVVLLRRMHRWLVRDGARFEQVTLRRAILPLGGYLAGLALWSVDLTTDWRWRWGVSSGVRAVDRLELMALVELLGVATLTGYAVAELRGRSTGLTRSAIGLTAGALIVTLIGARGYHPGRESSVAEAILLSVATFAGAILYWRQRAYVRAISRLSDHHSSLPAAPRTPIVPNLEP